MNTRRVEPIRDPRKVAAIKKMLRGQDNPRDYLLFVIGINTALPITDLLSLTVGDVLDERGEIRHLIEIRKQCARRSARIHLNANVREALAEYFDKIHGTDPQMPLFLSTRSTRPIDRTRAWRLISNWCRAVGLTHTSYGGQTLRKTWGYMACKVHGIPIKLIQAKLGHVSPAATMRYLGIHDEKITDVERRVLL